jgi:hypothetical protein
MLDTIGLDDQHEGIGNAYGSYHFEARAPLRQIANEAADSAAPIEGDRAVFQDASPRFFALVQRKCVRANWVSTP